MIFKIHKDYYYKLFTATINNLLIKGINITLLNIILIIPSKKFK